jgi:hypothetical protein
MDIDEDEIDIDIESCECCGVKELNGISDYSSKEVVKFVKGYRYDNDVHPPFYLFTGITDKRYAQRLANYIKRNKLGRVVQTQSKVNPNSNNHITAYLWQVNSRLDK